MSFKSIGITGSTGVLGSYIKKNFKSVKFDCFNGDVANKKDIQKWLKDKKFDALFHFAAVVPTKKVQKNYTHAKRVNYFGTKLLSPSQWFKGGSSGGGNLDKEKQDTTSDNSTNTQPDSKQYQDSLEKAQFGTTLNTVDVQNLKVIYGKMKTGEIASDDPEKDMAALKAAIDGYNLDQPQRDIVKNIISKV